KCTLGVEEKDEVVLGAMPLRIANLVRDHLPDATRPRGCGLRLGSRLRRNDCHRGLHEIGPVVREPSDTRVTAEPGVLPAGETRRPPASLPPGLPPFSH